jgi:hypothetical protein
MALVNSADSGRIRSKPSARPCFEKTVTSKSASAMNARDHRESIRMPSVEQYAHHHP